MLLSLSRCTFGYHPSLVYTLYSQFNTAIRTCHSRPIAFRYFDVRPAIILFCIIYEECSARIVSEVLRNVIYYNIVLCARHKDDYRSQYGRARAMIYFFYYSQLYTRMCACVTRKQYER